MTLEFFYGSSKKIYWFEVAVSQRNRLIPGWSLSLFDESESRLGEFKFDIENAFFFFLSGDENNNSPSETACFLFSRLISV